MSEDIRKVKLVFNEALSNQIMSYIYQCETECGGYAAIKKTGKNEYTVETVYICDQVGEPAYVRLDDKDSNRIKTLHSKPAKDAFLELLESNRSYNPNEVLAIHNKLKKLNDGAKILMYWHSHVNMGCTPSGTDWACVGRLAADKDFYFMLILNKMNEYSCNLVVTEPAPDVVPVQVDMHFTEPSAECLAKTKAELDKHVYSYKEYTYDEETMAIVKKQAPELIADRQNDHVAWAMDYVKKSLRRI